MSKRASRAIVVGLGMGVTSLAVALHRPDTARAHQLALLFLPMFLALLSGMLAALAFWGCTGTSVRQASMSDQSNDALVAHHSKLTALKATLGYIYIASSRLALFFTGYTLTVPVLALAVI